MICPKCGKENDETSQFCVCGHEISEMDSVEPTVMLGADQVAEQIHHDLEVKSESSAVTAIDEKSLLDATVNLSGKVIGKCRLNNFLGRGGMGLVYEGQHLSLDVPVAIKVMLPKYTEKEEFVKRFYREAQVAAKINHQNVARVYDCGREGNLLYIIMEYIDGGDVSEILDRACMMELAQVLEIGISVCNALIEAEKFNIIHRDIKPENIMMTADGTYKLVDLGLAKQVDTLHERDITLTLDNVCMGSPLYMPPEQAMDARSCDTRADIYSLGCSLFHMLAGRPPYDGDNWQEIVCQHATQIVPHVASYNKSVPVSLDRVLYKCMAKKSEERFESVRELRDALEAERSGKGASVADKSFTCVGVDSPVTAPTPTIARTTYKTQTSLSNTIRDTAVAQECSACGKMTPYSSLKYSCSECGEPICMDCWMRLGIHTCKEHSS